MGDAVLVFFGDPETRGLREDAVACLRMALEMKRIIAELGKEWGDKGIGRDFGVRMGITTGFCTVGNFGSEQRMDYTIIGNQVNLASRLQAAAQPGDILIAHETWLMLKDEFECTPQEPIHVKGFERPVKTYIVRGEAGTAFQDRTLNESCDGFSLSLDPVAVKPEQRADIIQKLKAAMDRLK
jgi:class 3 adenylate cyclase